MNKIAFVALAPMNIALKTNIVLLTLENVTIHVLPLKIIVHVGLALLSIVMINIVMINNKNV
jgi:hypothetical protein